MTNEHRKHLSTILENCRASVREILAEVVRDPDPSLDEALVRLRRAAAALADAAEGMLP